MPMPRLKATVEMAADIYPGLDEWWRDHARAAMGFAYVLSGRDRAAADDLLGDGMVILVRRWAFLETQEGAFAYLKVTMARLAARRRKRMVRMRWVPFETVEEPAVEDVDVSLVHTVRAAIARLTPMQRTVLVLRYTEDLPFAEIGRILGRSVKAVEATHRRALDSLRRAVGSDVELAAAWLRTAGEGGHA